MRRAMAVLIIIFLSTGIAWTGQLDKYLSVDNYFASKQIVSHNYYAANNVTDDLGGVSLGGDIYEYETKSTKRAFFYSLLVPGAGEYYAGSRIKPFVFFSAEVLIWTGYFVYHEKGNDKKNEYRAYADDHYYWQDFMGWWNSLTEAQQDSFSHTLPWDEENNEVIRNHEYYENIGKYNQFQYGWDDIDILPSTYGSDTTSEHRETYLNMCKKSNDYYQTASTMIMLSLANRVLSAFDAALTAKNFNKGQKRFSLYMKTKDFGNGEVPILTCNYKF